MKRIALYTQIKKLIVFQFLIIMYFNDYWMQKNFFVEGKFLYYFNNILKIGAANCILAVTNNIVSATSAYTITFRPTSTSATAKNLSKYINIRLTLNFRIYKTDIFIIFNNCYAISYNMHSGRIISWTIFRNAIMLDWNGWNL